jgi:uncharacterized peroxidase-related enzyme
MKPKPLETIPEELQDLANQLREGMGFLPNAFPTMAWSPELIKAAMSFMGFLRSPNLGISGELREMVSYMSSFGSGCRYCQAHTSHLADKFGVAKEKIDDLWRFEESEYFSEKEKAALSFALASGQSPNAVDESHYERLRQYFDERQVVELAGIVSIYGFLNRWHETVGTTLEDVPKSFAEDNLDASGWNPGRHA